MHWLDMILLLAPYSPVDAIALAYEDVQTLAPEVRPYIRYLWRENLPGDEWVKLVRVLSGHLNGTSRETEIRWPQVVCGGMMLRVNLLDYGYDPKVWDRLEDPVFTIPVFKEDKVKVTKTWPGGKWPADGKEYAAGSFTYETTEQKRIRADAWDSKEFVDLQGYTCSKRPIAGALWFLNQTGVQDGRKVGYYDLLGIKNQKDYETLVRFDVGLAKGLEHKRTILPSQIAVSRVRLVRRDVTVLGGGWSTFDSAIPTDKKNPLRVLDDELEFEATEKIFPLPNKMYVYLLANNKGTLQGRAPDNIVGGDRFRPHTNTQLEINRSCIGCHFAAVPHESGLKDLNILTTRRLDSPDYKKFLELQRQYSRADEFTDDLKYDRDQAAKAVKRATGWGPQEYGAEWIRQFDNYQEGRFSYRSLSRALGIPADQMKSCFIKVEKLPGGVLDPVLSAMIDGSVPKDLYEEVIYLAYKTWKEYGP